MRPISTLIIVIFALSFSEAQSDSWEYAFSEKSAEGSIFLDVVQIGDLVAVAGALNNCHRPALWIFDTIGNLLDTRDLLNEINTEKYYTYGKIQELVYDTTRHKIYAIGIIAGSDDVGAHTAAIFQFTEQFQLDTFFDFTVIADHTDQSISYHDSIFVVQESNQVYLLNLDFQVLDKIDFPVERFSQYVVHYQDGRLYTFEINGDILDNTVIVYNSEGDTIIMKTLPPFNGFELIRNSIVTLGLDGIGYLYDTALNLMEALQSELPERVELLKITRGTFAVINYVQGFRSSITVLDEALNFLYTLTTDLPDEQNINLEIMDNSWYQIGGYYSNRSVFGWSYDGIVPFVRKQPIVNGEMERPHLAITEATVLNQVERDRCYQNGGTEICEYSGEEATRYQFTVRNTGSQSINNFGYHTTIMGTFNCAVGNWYRDLKDLDLMPGEEINIMDSLFLYGNETPDSIDFYVVGPNHLLHEDKNRFTTVLNLTVSTAEHSKAAIGIYPNPAHNEITIDFDSGANIEAQILLYSIDGNLIRQQKLSNYKIDISKLTKGLYFLQIKTGHQYFYSKFIKE